jgi:hypothetical protein
MDIKKHKIQQHLKLNIPTYKITSNIHVLPEHIGCLWNFVFSYTEF